MEFRKSCKADLPNVIELWHRVFKDPVGFIKSNIINFVGLDNLYVYEQYNAINAILSAVPCEISGSKGVYLYALATAPELQGKGVMSKLMKHAEQDAENSGAEFAALIPASESLFGYYKKRGYTQETYVYEGCISLPDKSREVSEGLDIGTFLQIRKKCLKIPYLSFDSTRTAEIFKDLQEAEIKSVFFSDGYALYHEKNGTIKVLELVAGSRESSEILLGSIKAKTGIATASVQSGDSTLFTVYNKQHYALIKWLKPEYNHCEVYMRFGMDDVLNINA